ncbi:MAG: PBP1A family penicillin-binding protein [Armatimonadetes bacterium]|nr:PBP1A family penicillin-binding protein [Armatimonadota bacterium]
MKDLTFPGYGGSNPTPRSSARAGTRSRRFHWNWRSLLGYFSFVMFLCVLGVGAATAVWCIRALKGWERDLAAIVTYKPGQATFIYASDGSLLARVAKENRVHVPIDRIPVALRNATVATEDRRFWEHSGVDFRGMGRALWRDIQAQRAAEGGSTLTMQLVRNIQLTPEKTLERKVREAFLALNLERVYEKPRLLEMYLNQVFYGSGAYGVGAAARTYFNKPVGKLTVAQSALLATLPRRPTEYSPYRDPEGTLSRRNRLLKEMAAQGYLTPKQLNAALKEPLGVKSRVYPSVKAPYFVDAVVDRLVEMYGSEQVYQGGLRVYTTVNPKLQALAEKALKQGVHRLRGRNVTQGALVSIDPFTQEVKALVGGVDYRKSPFNRALALRQPGSVFKPFVYAAAFDVGISPLDKITDAPFRLRVWNGKRLHDRAWSPRNHNRSFAGKTSIKNAFAQSMNVPAVKLALSVGVSQVADTARACGIRSRLRELPSLALGTSEVTLLETTSSYGTFATMGTWTAPKLIRRVEDSKGTVMDRFDQFPSTVMDALTAQKVDYILRTAVIGGTARMVNSLPNARGKTGTTQDDKDAWFIGYTPELVTGVWLGNDRPSRMYQIWGGTGCAPIWKSFMSSALKSYPKRPPMMTWVPPKPTPKSKPQETDLMVASDPGTLKDSPDLIGETPAQEGAEWESSAIQEEFSPPDSQSFINVLPAREESTNTRKVRLCPESGELAVTNCPHSYLETVLTEERLGNCSIHRSKGEGRIGQRRASSSERSVDTWEEMAWGSSGRSG